MSVKLKTHKMLWGRSGNRCAICQIELVEDETETDDESIVGEECHIVAKKEKGPRGKSSLTSEQRDKYNNLMLLCNVHHKVIDDQYKKYTVKKLKEIKQAHESWVKSKLSSFDEKKQKDEEVYSTYLDEWEARASIDEWRNWTSHILSCGHPSIPVYIYDRKDELSEWILSRIWPKRYKELKYAFQNYSLVNQDFKLAFDKHKTQRDNFYYFDTFYISERFIEQERYDSLVEDFEAQVYLIEDLLLELTRAGNLICDAVRSSFYPSYRLKEGMLLVTTGATISNLNIHTHRIEYKESELTEIPYPGLNKFLTARFQRDMCFGTPEDNKKL